MSKILVNGITIEDGNIIPLLLRIKKWQKLKHEVTIIGNKKLDSKIKSLKIIKDYDFFTIKNTQNKQKKIFFLLEAIKRNFFILFKINHFLKKNYKIVFSISSVCDLILFPYLLKVINPKIIWVTVFDNIVPFTDPGNKIIRFLAWIFFKTSLFFLKKADVIFVISTDLKQYLINQGFNKNEIVVTGNGLETNLIKKAKKDKKYNFDALFIGRINETKGIFDMLDVLYIIKKTYPKFKLAIIGDGDIATKNKFINKINELKLQKNIEFLGYISGIKKFQIIKSSKCFWFLSVSKSESFGIALMEAVSCGLYGLVYDLPVFKKIYKNNEVIFSPIHDRKTVAKQVLKLFKSKKFNNQNGKKLLEKYSWENIIKIEYNAIKNIYKKFTSFHSPSDPMPV